MIVPKREKISSRSSSRVTGLSLHTKRTFSGGRTLAKGRSPTISSVSAEAAAACLRRCFSASSSGNSSRGSSSSAIRVELSWGRVGGESGTINPGGSGYGSSMTPISGLAQQGIRITRTKYDNMSYPNILERSPTLIHKNLIYLV